MPGNTEAEALEAFRESLQRTLDCVTQAVLFIQRGPRSPGQPRSALLNGGIPVPLAGSPRLHLGVKLRFDVAPSVHAHGVWTVHEREYIYSLWSGAMTELLAYHWHPTQATRVKMPHL